MAKIDTIQTSFAGGEFGPSLFGRTDISQYQNASEIVENFLVRPYGSAISAPGTRYVATASDSTLKTRLLKFIFNRSDAYVIEAGDQYMRFFTSRGQVVNPGGTEDLSAFSANLIAHYKMNDNTNSTTVIDTVGTHNGTASTVTQSLSTTGIVSTGFNLQGLYHISVADHANFTRTASTQPMTFAGWMYYSKNGARQTILSKSGEYELSVNSSDKMIFQVDSGNSDAKLLFHFNGTDGSTTFTDSSSSPHTLTAAGNAQLDTAQSKFGSASLLLDGTGDSIFEAGSADYALGTGDFTFDFWVRFATVGNCTFVFTDTSGGGNGFAIDLIGANLRVYLNGTEVDRAWVPSANTWYHLAVTRSGTDLRVFINGVQQGATVTNSTDVTTDDMRIGGDRVGNLNGWIDEFRYIKGSAVWTSDFVPADEPYQGSASNSWQVDESITEGWHLYALVFAGTGAAIGDCKIYIDGLPVSLTFTQDLGFIKMSNTASLFRIGTSSAAGANRWANKMDNLAFLHQALTAAEVLTLQTSSAYQMTTVYRENELFDVQYVQLNDVMWLTHKDHPPQKMIRVSASEWSIANFDFVGGPFLDENTNTSITITASATTGTVNLTVTPTTANLFTLSASTVGHHGAYWMIGGLSQTNTTTGLQEIGYVEITHVINSYTATATVIKNLKTSSATSIWAEGAWSAVRGYPACVTFHDSRLCFGRTNHEPQKVWPSKIFEYENFALDTQDDDDALNLALASNESNEIQWLASGRSLIAATFGGAFVISSGGDDVAITPDNAHCKEEVGIGSSSVAPKRIGGALLYLQKFKTKLREMFYLWDLDTYKAVDKTILAPHILGHGAIDMDYQQNPDSVLYCVRADGVLAAMTREVDQEVTAWSRHTTDGTYTSIAIIPSQTADYDEVWVIVERWVQGNQKKYIEYFENIELPDRQENALYLHSALTYNAFEQSRDSSTTLSFTALVVIDSSSNGHTVTMNGGAVVDTDHSVFGAAAACFDGSGDYLSIPDDSAWILGGGTGNFTIDCWVRITALPPDRDCIISHSTAWTFNIFSGFLAFHSYFDTLVVSGAFTFAINTWYHVAVIRGWGGVANTFALTVNGNVIGTTTQAYSIIDGSGNLRIGRTMAGIADELNWDLNGCVDEVRISTMARWTENFTPPTEPYANDGFTSLLLHFDLVYTATSSTTAFVAGDVGQRILAIDPITGAPAGEGQIITYNSGTSVTLSVTSVFTETYFTAGEWGLSVSEVSGLDHLEGKTVGVLADGLVESLTKTVASGTISLDDDYFIVSVGLSYDQIIYTLPREAGAQRGTAQGKLQRISELAFKLNRSYLGFQYGLDEDTLDTLTSVDSTLTQTLTTGIIGNIPFRGGYQRGTQIYIKNRNPLPIELLSIVATVDSQEK